MLMHVGMECSTCPLGVCHLWHPWHVKTEQQDIRLHIQDRLCDLLVYLIGGKSKQTEDTEKVKLDETRVSGSVITAD